MRRRNNQGNQHQMSPGGPLLTNHLRDLDIELELLKRKREIIEQKQDILNRERYSTKRPYDYNPPNPYDRQEPYGFSQQYEGSGNSGNYRPQGGKRQAEGPNYPWNAKRFNTPQINPWQMGASKDFSQERHFQPFQPQPVQFSAPAPAPLLSIKTHNVPPRPQKKFQPPPARKNFNPTKVTKPRPQASQAPNKLASYPVEKTKKLVNNAMKAIDKKPSPNQILRADQPPSAQVKGRLELALGIVMKQIKVELASADLDNFLQRLLKHTIRARIRALMLDKYVGAAADIVAVYRRHYPEETDRELLSVAKDAKTLQLVDADDPEEFFKKNMTNMLSTKLEDMFTKLEKLYRKEASNLDKYIDKLPEPKKDVEKKSESTSEPKTLTIEEMCGEDGNLGVIKERIAKANYYTKFMEELIEDYLPKIMPKFKNLLLSIVYCEKEFLGTKAMITAQLKKKILKTIEKDQSYLIHNKKVVSDPETNKSTTEESDANTESKENDTLAEPKVNQENISNKTSKPDNEVTADKVDENIKSTVEDDKSSQPKIEESEQKSVSEVILISDEPSKTQAPSPQTPKTPLSKEVHYVKLIGRPTLPARAVIYNFLNAFNPLTIKKHKSISNLLVIGFNDINNFNKILEANDSVVGESTIIIKASEQVNAAKSTPNQNKTDSCPNKTKSLNSSLEDSSILNPDLDSQITNLLNTIRNGKSEESVDVDKENDDTNNDTAAQDTVKVVEGDNNENVNTQKDEIDVSKENVEAENKAEDKIEENKNELSTTGVKETKPDQNNGTSDEKIKTNGQSDKTETFKSVELMETDKESEPIKENNDDKEISKKVEDKTKANVKETGRPATPTRSSSRLASSTPNSIRTRRTSRLQ